MEEGSLFQRMKQIFHEDEMDEEMQKEAAGLIRNIFRYMEFHLLLELRRPKKLEHYTAHRLHYRQYVFLY